MQKAVMTDFLSDSDFFMSSPFKTKSRRAFALFGKRNYPRGNDVKKYFYTKNSLLRKSDSS